MMRDYEIEIVGSVTYANTFRAKSVDEAVAMAERMAKEVIPGRNHSSYGTITWTPDTVLVDGAPEPQAVDAERSKP